MTSFYLKYRPQKIADLDLTSVREFFGRLLKSGRVHHAYLFAGPKGTGKTSAGRILAKIVNCEAIKRQELREPCNKCGNCLAIMRGGFPDLIEIDAASNRGIDDVRSLRETVVLAPFKGRVKVYLIDEVHMLTHEAFNALLKTLEEPPAHVILILATTEPEKVPATVVSRCVQVNFERATSQEVKRSLEKVVAGERLKVEPEVLTQLTKAAEGSFRDAQKLLEQMVMGREKNKLTVEQVRKDLGRGMKELIRKWLTLAVAGEVKLALEELNRLDKAGVVWKEVVVESVELVREALFYKLGLGKKGGEGELVRLEVEELKELVRRLLQAGRELREAVVPQLPLELLTVEWGARGAGVRLRVRSPTPVSLGKEKVKFEEVQAKWQEVLARLKPKNHSLAGLLRSSRPVGIDGEKLLIEVFYQFHLDQLQQEKFQVLVEETVAEVFAFPLRLDYSLGNPLLRKAEGGELADDELVKAAEEIFGG